MALNHEFIHAYSILIQPPQLLPLDDVFKNADYSSIRRFEDLVESLCEAYYNILFSHQVLIKISFLD